MSSVAREAAPTPITAFAMCNALGRDRRTVADALMQGRSGLGASPIEVPFPTAVGAVVGELPELPASLAPWSTRTAQIASALLEQMDADLERVRSRFSSERIAVILGTSTAGADVTEAAYRHFVHHGSLPEGYDLWRHHTYGAVLEVVRALSGAAGPSWVVSTACTSSAKPFASAQRLINAGIIDAAIVGGIDTLCAMTLRGFHSLGALSAGACRPFAADRDGISIGEGGAFLLLERGGDGIAVLEAVGESSDAYHVSAPHPEGLGAALSMERALAQAGRRADEIDHINAHGTGTRLNDSAEAAAIERLFGTSVPVISTKGYTGHTLGAAGATEAAMLVLAIDEGWIPMSIGAAPRDPGIALNVATSLTRGRFRAVISNSFAFGGNNVSLLLGAP